MFFPERIVSIEDTDKVLEVGPGGTPYPRSDVLLEKIFDEKDAREQRGYTEPLNTKKKVIFYEGDNFPFEDKEFDYIICSHVLEHISEDKFHFFIDELQRVSKKGYIEYPTVYYEYLYNFKVHTTFLNYKNNVIWYMGKNKSNLNNFFSIQKFFYKTLECGFDEVLRGNKEYFFQGFEWKNNIKIQKTNDLQEFSVKGEVFKKKEHAKFVFKIKSLLKKIFE